MKKTKKQLIKEYKLKESHEYVVAHQDEFIYDLNQIFDHNLSQYEVVTLPDLYQAVKETGLLFSQLSNSMGHGSFLPNFLWQAFYGKYVNNRKNTAMFNNVN